MLTTICYQGQALSPVQHMAEVRTPTKHGTEVLCLHAGRYFLHRTLDAGAMYVHRLSHAGAQLWQEAVQAGQTPCRKSQAVTPARGAIDRYCEVWPATSTVPAERYYLNLNVANAELLRVAPRLLQMDTDAFILACLRGELRVEECRLPSKTLATVRQMVGEVLAALTEEDRAILTTFARTKGFSSALDYLVDETASDYREVYVYGPKKRVRFPRSFWRKVTGILGLKEPASIVAPSFVLPILAAAA